MNTSLKNQILGVQSKNICNTSHSVAIDVKIITPITDTSTYFQIKVLHSYSIYTILIYIVR